MRKSKALVEKAAEAFVKELQQAFPGVDAEILFERIEGGDVWVRLEIPPELQEKDDLRETFVATKFRLRWEQYERTGVYIVITTYVKEAVPHG